MSEALRDAFLSKFDPLNGTLIWTRQLSPGKDKSANSFGVSVDADDNIYITGRTSGVLPGMVAGISGPRDAFVSRFAVDGQLVWSRNIGSTQVDDGLAISNDAQGNIYITGSTGGALPGQLECPDVGRVNNSDVFVASFRSNGLVVRSTSLELMPAILATEFATTKMATSL